MAQLDFLVGDVEGNMEKIIDYSLRAKNDLQADLVIFPELALTGYPPEDLLFRQAIYERTEQALKSILQQVKGIDVILGYPEKKGEDRFNAACLIQGGEITATYYKACLPNYSVFDEVRYFTAGDQPLVVNYHGLSLGIIICEDLWHKKPLEKTVAEGANFIISLNASPFDSKKHEARLAMLQGRARESLVPILYLNCVGGQDELVFDGGSLVLSSDGVIHQRGPFYKEQLIPVDITYEPGTHDITISDQPILKLLSQEERIYGALVCGVRDYIEKNNFPSAIVGLSGGIDSALTLAIAVDAIGADRVSGILMPSRYTSEMSNEDALKQAALMNVKTSTIPIEEMFNNFVTTLTAEFQGPPNSVTQQNLQARCRGLILMGISNNCGALVLSTGNKSEISVGYCTLYGDMVGGFSVLKDIPKTLVYQLANYRNKIQPVIPERVITREPSAELAPNQKDQDTLPPYSILDQILELYVEQDESVKTIVAKGFDEGVVKKVVLLVDKSEYKRRQAPPGVRVTRRAFGRDRRYPITSGYHKSLK